MEGTFAVEPTSLLALEVDLLSVVSFDLATTLTLMLLPLLGLLLAGTILLLLLLLLLLIDLVL